MSGRPSLSKSKIATPLPVASNPVIEWNSALLVILRTAGKAGLAIRHYKVVKSDRPEDLLFQSVKTGAPMRDNNILSRHIKPAARKLGLPWINWRCLRTSHATWMVEAGANPKDVQGQMRHSRISTTMDIYAQFVPESQRRALAKMSAMVESRTSKPVVATGGISMPPQSRMVN
jgi:integrase